MAVYKEEKTNTWRAVYRYTDWNGERKQTQKRGFKTKREAQAWEREQLNKSTADLHVPDAGTLRLLCGRNLGRLRHPRRSASRSSRSLLRVSHSFSAGPEARLPYITQLLTTL